MSLDFFNPLFSQIETMWVDFVQLLPQLFIALIALFVTWATAKLLKRSFQALLKRARIRPSLLKLLGTFIQTIIWIIGLLIAATIVFPSLTPANMLAALGLGSLAVGLAFKDIFENYMAGVLIMLRKPMRIGDYIECEGMEGKVEDITIRDTYIRQTDDQLLMLPNAFVYKNPVHVMTDKPMRRFEIVCGVAYDVNMDAAQKVIRDTLESLDGIHTDRGIDVFAREFNSSSMDFTVRWWAQSTPRGMHESRDKVVRAIKRALDEAGMEIPFPYRTLTFKEPLPVTMNRSDENG
jgi:small conductance mechanosensitive channel